MNRSRPAGCWRMERTACALSGVPSRDLVGRRWEMSAVEAMLDRAIEGHGAVVGVVGPPGIGKSRLVREVAAMAAAVVSRCSPPSASRTPARSRSMPWRGCCARPPAWRISTTRPPATECATRFPMPTREDLLLLDDLLGIADPDVALPKIDPDARRRRLTALVNAASLARTNPAVYVVEDAHWIDEVSESMLVDFLTVIPQHPVAGADHLPPRVRGGADADARCADDSACPAE